MSAPPSTFDLSPLPSNGSKATSNGKSTTEPKTSNGMNGKTTTTTTDKTTSANGTTTTTVTTTNVISTPVVPSTPLVPSTPTTPLVVTPPVVETPIVPTAIVNAETPQICKLETFKQTSNAGDLQRFYWNNRCIEESGAAKVSLLKKKVVLGETKKAFPECGDKDVKCENAKKAFADTYFKKYFECGVLETQIKKKDGQMYVADDVVSDENNIYCRLAPFTVENKAAAKMELLNEVNKIRCLKLPGYAFVMDNETTEGKCVQVLTPPQQKLKEKQKICLKDNQSFWDTKTNSCKKSSVDLDIGSLKDENVQKHKKAKGGANVTLPRDYATGATILTTPTGATVYTR